MSVKWELTIVMRMPTAQTLLGVSVVHVTVDIVEMG